jgi:hypothetical protein
MPDKSSLYLTLKPEAKAQDTSLLITQAVKESSTPTYSGNS